jgi:hypothetical protein
MTDERTAPTPRNAEILACAAAGLPLPPGDYPFTAPLDLTDLPGLCGTFGLTTLRPLTAAPGALLRLRATQPGDPVIGLPRRQYVANLRIIGSGVDVGQHGLYVDGAGLRCERVEVVECTHGIVLEFSVDTIFRDCVIARNACAVYSPGRGPHSVTTTHFQGCQLRCSTGAYGVLIQQADGVFFEHGTIIESNACVGLCAAPRVDTAIIGGIVQAHGVWFENNGEAPYSGDPAHLHVTGPMIP